MALRINKYIRTPEKVGVTSIYYSVIWNLNRLLFQAGESIHSSDWNNDKYQPKQKASTALLIARLNKLEQKIRDDFEALVKEHGIDAVKPKMLKERIFGKQKVSHEVVKKAAPKVRIVDFIQQFMDDTRGGSRLSAKKMKIKSDSVKPYGNIKLAFTEFETDKKSKFYLNQINQDLLDDFETYLINEKKLALNTRTKYLQMLMVVFKYAEKKKLIPSQVVPSVKIAVITEQSDSIYLNEREIAEFAKYKNPNDPFLEFIRDMVLIGAYSGLRHSDFCRLTEKNFFESRIRTIQKKVGEKVVIPMHPLVKEIFQKYSSGFPYQCPKSTQKFNEFLREVSKAIPCLDVDIEKRITKGSVREIIVRKKYDCVTSHVCRRSFCTNELLAGTSIELIMAISGHKTYKSFIAYVKATAEEKADVLDKIWQTRYGAGNVV